MVVYSNAGLASGNALFDQIVANIDATLSGNTTGWNIVEDARDSGRVPTATDYRDITRANPLQVQSNFKAAVDLNADLIIDARINHMFEDENGVIRAHVVGTPSSGYNAGSLDFWLVTSSDGGVSWSTPSQPNSYYVDSATGSASVALTTRRMGTDSGYIQVGVTRNGSFQGTTRLRNQGSIPVFNTPQLGTFYDANLGITGVVPNSYFRVPGYRYSNNITYCPDTQQFYAFMIGGDATSTFIIVNRFSSPDTVANFTADGDWKIAFRPSDLGVTAISGVVGVEPAPGGLLDLFVYVAVAGVPKVIKVRSSSTNFLSASWSILDSEDQALKYFNIPSSQISGFRVVSGTDQIPKYVFATSVASGSTTPNSGDYWESTGVNNQAYVKAFKSGVAGIPDYNGLEYEWVVLQSTHTYNSGNGYFVMLLQPNPIQAGPPSVTDITDRAPIFMRPLRNFVGGQPLRFGFDPIIPNGTIPGTVDYLAPALIGIPDITDIPAETHNLQMKVNAREIFIYTDTSGGNSGITDQWMFYNIAEPLATLANTNTDVANDNVFCASAGHILGHGAVVLGKNGGTEIADSRGDGDTFYPIGYMASYDGILTDTNSVDNEDYSFPVYGACNDVATIGTSLENGSFSFSTGILEGIIIYSRGDVLNTGDTFLVGATTYKVFKADATAGAYYPGSLVNTIAVEWS